MRQFIRMMQRSQPPKPRLDSFLIGERGDAQHAVKVACDLDLVEGFVEGVEEVAGYDENEDAAAMARVFGGGRLRTRFAGADCDAVVDALEEGGCVLFR